MTIIFLSGMTFLGRVYSSEEKVRYRPRKPASSEILGILRHTWSGVLEMLIRQSHRPRRLRDDVLTEFLPCLSRLYVLSWYSEERL